MLFWLISRPSWVVEIRLAALLDMSTQYVSNRMDLHKVDKPFRTCSVNRNLILRNIQAPGIQTVAGHQVSRPAIVKRDAGHVMAGNGNDVDDAVSEINLPDVCRPICDSRRLLDLRRGCGDKLDLRYWFELA